MVAALIKRPNTLFLKKIGKNINPRPLKIIATWSSDAFRDAMKVRRCPVGSFN
jgi:hypothetical protein